MARRSALWRFLPFGEEPPTFPSSPFSLLERGGWVEGGPEWIPTQKVESQPLPDGGQGWALRFRIEVLGWGRKAKRPSSVSACIAGRQAQVLLVLSLSEQEHLQVEREEALLWRRDFLSPGAEEQREVWSGRGRSAP